MYGIHEVKDSYMVMRKKVNEKLLCIGCCIYFSIKTGVYRNFFLFLDLLDREMMIIKQ